MSDIVHKICLNCFWFDQASGAYEAYGWCDECEAERIYNQRCSKWKEKNKETDEDE